MQYTTNLNLKKPEQDDAYDIQNENDNMDILDTKIKQVDDNVNSKVSGDTSATPVKVITKVAALPSVTDPNTLYLIP